MEDLIDEYKHLINDILDALEDRDEGVRSWILERLKDIQDEYSNEFND